MTKKQHALTRALEGWNVFPGRDDTGGRESKLPRIAAWPERATRDPEQIERWWTRWPDANVLGYTGRFGDNGAALVVDIDCKEGAQGFASFDQLKKDGLKFTPTRTHRTPSGGLHLIYSVPEPVQSRNGMWPGIDIKSARAYVVLPGSTIGGKPYTIGTDGMQ